MVESESKITSGNHMEILCSEVQQIGRIATSISQKHE